jgi:hypothetical protein
MHSTWPTYYHLEKTKRSGQTAHIKHPADNGNRSERIQKNEGNATKSRHKLEASVEKPTHSMGVRGNHIHVVRRGTRYSSKECALAHHPASGVKPSQKLRTRTYILTPPEGMQRGNGHLVLDKGPHCTVAAYGPALGSRRLVYQTLLSIMAVAATQGDTVNTGRYSNLSDAATKIPVAIGLYRLLTPFKMEVVPGGQTVTSGK